MGLEVVREVVVNWKARVVDVAMNWGGVLCI